MKQNRKKITLGIKPSLMRIFNMEKEVLLSHYALIAHKASSLSSAQRNFLINFVNAKIAHGSLSLDEAKKVVDDLSNSIKEEILEGMKTKKA